MSKFSTECTLDIHECIHHAGPAHFFFLIFQTINMRLWIIQIKVKDLLKTNTLHVLQWALAATAPGVWRLCHQNRRAIFLRQENHIYFFSPFPCLQVSYSAFQFPTCLFLALGLIPTHHWYSPLKANSSRKHLGPRRNAALTEYPSFQEAGVWLRKKHPVAGRSTSPYGIQHLSQTFCHACCSRGHYEPDLFGMPLWAHPSVSCL